MFEELTGLVILEPDPTAPLEIKEDRGGFLDESPPRVR
jgi:hypothetical protein